MAGGTARSKNKATVEDFCNRIHKGILRHFKYALVWGTSVKHRPQKVGASHFLEDEVRPSATPHHDLVMMLQDC